MQLIFMVFLVDLISISAVNTGLSAGLVPLSAGLVPFFGIKKPA
jgi:hypothetical protein